MWIFEIIVLFLFGLVFGSFLNVLIWRLDVDKAPKFWQGRSMCPKCKHSLAWQDNIPLLSYMLLVGKCRYCRKPISLQYPIVELTTAVVTVVVGWITLGHISLLGLLGYLIVSYAFIVIFFADWIYGLIPDEMEIVIVVVSALGYLGNLGILSVNLMVGLASAAAFLLIVVATRFRGMGLGDVKLAFVIGFLLGFPLSLLAFWVSFVLGGIFALGLLILHRKKFRDTIALGPFLVLGTLIATLWGRQILQLAGI